MDDGLDGRTLLESKDTGTAMRLLRPNDDRISQLPRILPQYTASWSSREQDFLNQGEDSKPAMKNMAPKFGTANASVLRCMSTESRIDICRLRDIGHRLEPSAKLKTYHRTERSAREETRASRISAIRSFSRRSLTLATFHGNHRAY
nr:hypothetical protein CFP56_70435 [Quercus suber]